LGPIISRLFTCSNAEKNKLKKQRVLALVLSLCRALYNQMPIEKSCFITDFKYLMTL
jgi:hypothetical protein